MKTEDEFVNGLWLRLVLENISKEILSEEYIKHKKVFLRENIQKVNFSLEQINLCSDYLCNNINLEEIDINYLDKRFLNLKNTLLNKINYYQFN